MDSNSSCITTGTIESDSYVDTLSDAEFEHDSGNNSGQSNGDNTQPSNNTIEAPPIVFAGSCSIMQPHFLEIAPGDNVISALHQFYRRLEVGALCLLSCTGTVADVTISHFNGSPRYFPGTFSVITLSGFILPNCSSVSIAMSGPQMEVIGGNVEGVLRAFGPLYVTAASCPSAFGHTFSLPPNFQEDNAGAGANPNPSLDSNGNTPKSCSSGD